MALNSVHGDSLNSDSTGVFTTSRHPPTTLKQRSHAEAGVKAMKTLVVKTTPNGNLDSESFARGVLEWRNTLNARGKNPAQLLLGGPISSFILTHRRNFNGALTTRADSANFVPCEQLPHSPKTSDRILPNLPLWTNVDIQGRPDVQTVDETWRHGRYR